MQESAQDYAPEVSWLEEAAPHTHSTRRTPERTDHAKVIVSAAERLLAERGGSFTTQEVTKEAGVALQTFYRYFESKDKLLLAVFEDMTTRAVERYAQAARELGDPIERLRLCVMAALEAQGAVLTSGPKFITAEYWRLYELFPEEMSRATQPFVDTTARELRVAVEAGLLSSDDPEHDAWLITKLVMAVYHHRAFAPLDPPAERAKERVWAFCLAAWQVRPQRET
jgi:AcrR family transcriptional regulator